MILDMKTIVFSNVITNIICLVFIALLWQQSRKRFSGTGFFVFNFALQTAALFLIISRGSIPDWMSIVLANTMVIAGALLGYMGLLRFLEKKSSQVHNYILLAVFAFIHTYVTFVQPDLAARNLNLSVGLLIICGQCSWLMLYRTEPDKRPLTRGVGLIFIIYCVVSVIRIIDYFTVAQTGNDFFQSGIFTQLVLISYQMLFILLTYALVLMFNKSLLTDVKTEEEKFSKAFHSSPNAIVITRLIDGQIIEVNEGFSNITGYQPADVEGKTMPALHLWDKDEERDLVVKELTAEGKVQPREFSFRKKSGEMITGLFSAEIITINNKQCVLSSINDITGRKQTEDALQIKNLVFDTSITANSIVDTEGVIIEINDSFLRLWGYTNKDEVIGHPLSNFFNDMNEADASIASLNRSGHWQGSFTAKKKDGSIFIAYSTATVIQDKNGRTTGYQSSVSDITEQKRAESEKESALKEIYQLNTALENKVAERTGELHNTQLALLNLVDDLNQSAKNTDLINRKLEETNKELAAFSYSVSHDLRAPLRSIDGFSLALLEDYQEKLDETGRHYLNKIRAATQHMGSLIEDMLKLSRITHAEFHHESIDLSKIVQSIADTLRQSNPDKDVRINIQKDIVVHGDRNFMEIAMTNLLENAWKFTGKQNNPLIEFGMTLTEQGKIFFVRDNGVGFDMAYVNKLFGAFQRLHGQNEFPGTGIGLATVKRIITRHGGQIWAEGEAGKGATFFFTLPE